MDTGDAGAPVVGAPMDRVDGRLKVTGGARYSAEMPVADVAHGYLVLSTIPRGRIARMDTSEAEHAPGVIAVMTPANAPRLPQEGRAAVDPPAGRVLSLLQDDLVHYDRQPIAVVVADTFEHARDAAALVRVRYATEPPLLDMAARLHTAYPPKQANREPTDSHRGDVDAAIRAADVRIDHTYRTPVENHNPMEPHATIAVWEGERLTVYDATQGVWPDKKTIAKVLGLQPEQVRVVSHFIGGGFGCKGSTWSHVLLAAMAAKQAKRPVKVVLARPQMFGPVGMRPHTVQRVTLGARRDGTLTAVRHASTSNTSMIEDWLEPCALVTRMLYASDTAETTHRLVKLNYGTPTFMRAPGEATGTFAIESAMDELAVALHMDPIELRLRNYAERDPDKDKPFSSKSLRQCYARGAERFGWSRRSPAPRSMREGNTLVGYGMATATYPARRSPASARARILPDGRALVETGSQDIGTGTYTVMTQLAAESLALPVERVRVELGDTSFPETPVSGGSQTAASTGSAVHLACVAVRDKIARLAIADAASPLHGADVGDIRVQDGRFVLASDPSRGQSYAEILARAGGQPVEATVRAQSPDQPRPDAKPTDSQPYSEHSFGAIFVEARVDEDLGAIRIPRVVGVYAAGRILNAKTARSQFLGGIVYGLGMALMEETHFDPRRGRVVNADLAEYHVPVNADVPDIDISWVDEFDPHVTPIGVKGIGEIGITGVAAAVANAVYHATGTRVRELPITLDKLL